MALKLIVAEKPSVAADIARALGGFSKKKDYFESDHYVVASAVGHLLQLALPESHDVKKGKWSFTNLPVIPPQFDLAPIERSTERLNLLLRLIKRKDITGLINACDAGREGELIFRYLVQHARSRKPIERLWLQSMTPQAIRDGFGRLRGDPEMLPLADAAQCRSEADWLVGINGTRAMTAFNSREGGFYLTTVGRVQTPTLAILVEREEKIRSFKPRSYWEIHGRFAVAAGEYSGRWFDEAFRKDDDPERRAERLWSVEMAERIAAECRNGSGSVSEETKPSTQSSPLLFDLTSLQREANGRFGFSARTTLSLAQALYERHKLLTYPRTDSRALPTDYLETVKQTMSVLTEHHDYAQYARTVLEQDWVRPTRRVFDDSKISDHFAIIPTLQSVKTLNEAESKVYELVVRRFLAIFHPAAEYLQTIRITRLGTHAFRTEGRVLQKPGWLNVYGRSAGEEGQNLVALASGESAKVSAIVVEALETRPPPRFSEATLLSAMEGAGKLVEDDELRAAMEAKGLGTPATRAATIEGLVNEEYVHRVGRELVPSPKAFSLLFALRHFGVHEITSPELTGDWEHKLKLMESGRLPRSEFMSHIEQVTRDLVDRIRDGTIPETAFAVVSAPCPKCGGMIQENYRKFQCQKCDFSLWKVLSGREWSTEEVAVLIEKRFIGPLTGFRSRMGKPFAAGIRLNSENRIEFDFGQDRADESSTEPVALAEENRVGACPKCSAGVFDQGVAYVCEKALGSARSCDFRSGKIILQQAVEREQMVKLLASGRTDLLPRFISKRGRPFKAFLVKTASGRIGFEFLQKVEGKSAKPKPAPESAKEQQPPPIAAAGKTTARKTGSRRSPATSPGAKTAARKRVLPKAAKSR